MASVTEHKIVRYLLELTEEEACYLKAMMQNPIIQVGSGSIDESADCAQIRENMWRALNEAGVM